MLSGTPQHNEFDLFNQYRMLAREEPLFKQSFTDFKRWLCVFPPGQNFPARKSKSDPSLRYKPGAREALAAAIAPYTHTADASLMHLWEPIVTETPVDLDETEHNAYDDMERVLRAELPDGNETAAEIVLTKLLRLTQIAAGHATSTEGDMVRLGRSKLEATLDLLDQRPNQKVVIAYRFREDGAGLVAALNERGRALAKIDGGTPAKFRTQYEDWFEKGRHDNGVILLQYQAGGVAITLATARTLILYTLDPSVIRFRQMIGRVWRIGQENAVEILPLLANDTQDWAMWAALQAGADNANIAKMLRSYLFR
jgi:superfamily II DNA or RNA helicase